MRRSLTLVAAVALVLGTAPNVQATPTVDRTQMITARLHALWMAGVPEAVRFTAVEREFGIDILNVPNDVEPQATNNDAVQVPQPTVWYDIFAEYHYGVSASFKWNYTCGKNRNEACWLHFGAGQGEGPVGGDDGFALQIDAPVKTRGGGLILDPN